MTERQARDEGAEQTRLIMHAVKGMRTSKGWSAQQLADEMTKAGVPWNADVVVNLEHGRRKSLRVHEALALAYVLGAESPLDVLVPWVTATFPITPDVDTATGSVRDWFRGETGPLRAWLEADPDTRNRGDHERAIRRWREAVEDASLRGIIRASGTDLLTASGAQDQGGTGADGKD